MLDKPMITQQPRKAADFVVVTDPQKVDALTAILRRAAQRGKLLREQQEREQREQTGGKDESP